MLLPSPPSLVLAQWESTADGVFQMSLSRSLGCQKSQREPKLAGSRQSHARLVDISLAIILLLRHAFARVSQQLPRN